MGYLLLFRGLRSRARSRRYEGGGSPGGTYDSSRVRGHMPGAGDVRGGVAQGVLTMVPGSEVTCQEQEMLGR